MNIPSVTKQYAIKLLSQLSEFRNKFPGNKSPYVLLSDEWYILANHSFPSLAEYGDVDLVENGVGQVMTFLNNFYCEAKSFPVRLKKVTKITIVTGILIAEIFKTKILPILNKINNLTVCLIPIENNFYGHSVTVSGLLTGQDIINQLKSKDLGNEVWLSHRILNDERICTLDDMTLNDISNQLNCNVKVSEDSFKILLEGIAFG